MKKVVAAAAAFLAAVAPCSMFFASIEPVRASASDVTLTPAQTLALFGDTLSCSYKVADSAPINGTFSYYGLGVIDETRYSSQSSSYKFDPTNSQIVVYQSDFTDTIYDGSTSNFALRLKPSISLSGLTNIQFSMGISCNPLYVPSLTSSSYSSLNKIEYRFKINGNSSYYSNSGIVIWEYDSLSNRIPMYTGTVFISSDGNTVHDVPCNITQVKQTDSSNSFEFMFDPEFDSNGFFAYRWFTQQNDGHYYFYIACPTLSDTYVNNNPSSSVPDSGIDSGADYPDYSGDLLDIINRLDAIILQNNTIIGQNSSIDNHLVSANDKLNQNNSKLDQVNSNLNKIDSHIQALQIPDLMSQSSGDMSHIAQNESKNNSDLSAADANQQIINSVAGYGDVSLPNLENVHSMPDDFSELWNYTDQDGLSWVNPILYAMPILTLTVGALAYIVFGRAR